MKNATKILNSEHKQMKAGHKDEKVRSSLRLFKLNCLSRDMELQSIPRGEAIYWQKLVK